MTATPSEASSSRLDESRYMDIDTVLDRKGGWTEDHFVGGQAVCPTSNLIVSRYGSDGQAKDALRRGVKILVIGAGGLGCEILQNLALSMFKCYSDGWWLTISWIRGYTRN